MEHDRQADRQRAIDPEREQSTPPPPLVGRTGHGNSSRGGKEWWQPRVQQQHSTHPPHVLVCPGCGQAGIRGGVRCSSGGTLATSGEPKLHDEAASTDTITDQFCTEDMRAMEGTAECSAGKERAVRGEGSASHQSSPTDVSASSAGCAHVGSTFHTSLGVIVDACTWWRHGDADSAGMTDGVRTTRNENHAPHCIGGKNGQNNPLLAELLECFRAKSCSRSKARTYVDFFIVPHKRLPFGTISHTQLRR